MMGLWASGPVGFALAVAIVLSAPPPGESGTQPPEQRAFTVLTSPVVAGFEVSIEGVGTATTDDSGSAVFELDTIDGIRDRVSAVTTSIMVDDSTQFRFNAFQRYRREGVTAAFNVDYLTHCTFHDRNNNAVDPSLVERMTLQSSVGEILEVVDPEYVWLHGTRVLSNNIPREIYWTVQDVVVGGASVVNRSEHRIIPSEQSRLDIELLMYDLSVVVRNRWIGGSAGDTIALGHPDGSTSVHELQSGRATLRSLPRGEYSAIASGAGLGVRRPIALSRDQEVRLHLFSWFEIGSVLVLLSALVIVPVLIGRRRRTAHSTPSPDHEPTVESGSENV